MYHAGAIRISVSGLVDGRPAGVAVHVAPAAISDAPVDAAVGVPESYGTE